MTESIHSDASAPGITPEITGGIKPRSARSDFLWSLPQPILVFGALLLVATAATTEWMDVDLLTDILILSPLPVLLVAERLLPKRADWMLDSREYAEDLFWVLGTFVIWAPIYGDYYDTPISNAFVWLREASALPLSLGAETTGGLVIAALIAIFASELIYYWLHRLQHRMMFFWRIHAIHHHITKMGVARADRTHPLEFLALNIGPVMVLAFLGASDDVVAASLVFRFLAGHINHVNMPLKSGVYGWLFTTAEQHQLHHSLERQESDRNFGCTVILWDRIFGTFSGKEEVARIGNGTGKALSILTQLSTPFRSNATLRNL